MCIRDRNTTLLVLKIPKTESSVRKVFLPRSVAEMLQKWKLKQLNTKMCIRDRMGRMHDKYLIADGKRYILGGRNTYNYFLGDFPGRCV